MLVQHKVFPLQARLWCRGCVEVQLYSSMTTALEGGDWSAASPGRTLPPGKTRFQLYRGLGGPQGRSGLRKISPHRDSIPGPSILQSVGISADLPGPYVCVTYRPINHEGTSHLHYCMASNLGTLSNDGRTNSEVLMPTLCYRGFYEYLGCKLCSFLYSRSSLRQKFTFFSYMSFVMWINCAFSTKQHN